MGNLMALLASLLLTCLQSGCITSLAPHHALLRGLPSKTSILTYKH